MRQQTKDVLKLAGLTLLITFCLLAPTAFADTNIVEFDPPGDTTLVEAYEIERAVGDCTGTPTWVQIATLPKGTHRYDDENIAPGATFCYRAFSWNQDEGRSLASNTAWKRVPFPLAPPAPANLRAR